MERGGYNLGMIADTIRERLRRDPFEPFYIRTSGGQAYLVSSPELVVLMKSEVFVAQAKSDRWASLPYLHVAGIESAGSARSPRKRRGA
jgi:hypothetical protein